MKKILIILLLLSIIVFADGVPLSAEDVGCVKEQEGIYYCIEENYITNIDIKFIEDVICVSSGESTTGSMFEIMDGGCLPHNEIASFWRLKGLHGAVKYVI